MRTYSLNVADKTPLYEQLYRALRQDILSGVIAGGEKLPSRRQLATHLHISQITVETAYNQLLEEGYLITMPRKGYFVQSQLISPPPPVVSVSPSFLPRQKHICRYDFRINTVDTKCFPFSTWARLSRQMLSKYAEKLLYAVEPNGVSELREEIRRYLYNFRGLNISVSNILVGAGSEYLLPLILQLLGTRRIYALENPGYRKVYQIFARNGATVRPLPLDDKGLRVDALEQSDAEIVYLTPSHHFPLGTVMPIARRLELLRWANAAPNRYIIEDDYDSEFRYVSRPIPPLGELDHTNRVVYVNTFAKSLMPSLRISYCVLPAALTARFHTLFSLYSSTAPSLEQYTLAEFMRTGSFERHISRSRKIYQTRRDTLLTALQKEFIDIPYSISGEEAGLHILLSIRNGMNETTLIEKARSAGVRVYALSDYYDDPAQSPPATLLLGYADMTEEQIREGARLLRGAWKFHRF